MSTPDAGSSVVPPLRGAVALWRYHFDPRELLLIGVVTTVLGAVAVTAPVLASAVLEWVLAVCLIAAGALQVMHAFQIRKQGAGFVLPLLVGAVYLIGGLLLMSHPLGGLVALTVVLAAFLATEGIAKMAMAWALRRSRVWSWFAINGVVSLLLGGLILSQWPSDALWVIGLLFGVDLLVGGLLMIAAAWGLNQERRAKSS